jgi:FKBP-type peptidyl-prolyl cis-trans isomerase
MRSAFALPLVVLALGACEKTPSSPPTLAPHGRPQVAVAPTVDLTPPADATATNSGLRTKVLGPGSGTEHPEPQDLVEVHYTGWKSDGTTFDSSRDRNAPVQFTVEETIKGWSEGVQLMVTGEKRRLWVPATLAYGDKPGDRAPAGPLVFDLELLKIIKRPRPLPAPSDLASPPPRKTRSGLAYRVLTKGTGKQHPGAGSVVEVHYTGWAPSGRMLDSSVVRGQPQRLQMRGAGRGWAEALRLMVVGEKTRFWIPPSLASEMGSPAPTAVYDVELLAIH